jgi:DNA-binding response OmpR family regulator
MVEYSALIVDDDIWMQRILSKTLQSYGFQKTFLASNAFEGISLAVENLPTIIILDILMPELSGHLALKILKSIKITKNIPVLMVSALSDTENLGLAVKSGTAGFISKPFTRATIFDKLIAIFGKDKLEHIQKGEVIESDLYHYEETVMKSDNDYMLQTTVSSDRLTHEQKSNNYLIPQSDTNLQTYKEDEKRTIESIKKLLMKSKK